MRAGGRVFLFLQGPHGPFFRRLAAALVDAGDRVLRVAFNAADEAEWDPALGPLEPYLGRAADYPGWLGRLLLRHRVTDLVLYGDARAEHAWARFLARRRGLRCHCFEEGYLRPFWVTYERGGNNGASPLVGISLAEMAEALAFAGGGEGDAGAAEPAAVPEGWGAARAHLLHSTLYHGRLLLPSRRYGRPPMRRDLPLWREGAGYLHRVTTLPARRLAERRARRLLAAAGRPWHLVLLQLSFDSSMQAYSPYRRSAAFVEDCLDAFAAGAPPDDLLLFRTHPFEDGRERLGQVVREGARRRGLTGRVLLLDGGGSLGPLLDGARSVVTVNSTAAHFALARGIPVRALGQAIYARPPIVSTQPLADFFAHPGRPDPAAYGVLRRFLLATSQLEGSFYTRDGIERLLARLTRLMRAPEDPYEALLARARRGRAPQPPVVRRGVLPVPAGAGMAATTAQGAAP